MRGITLLDCTLRDGGYVNNWQFGRDNIRKLIRKVLQAGVEIVECGYLDGEKGRDGDTARFAGLQDVEKVCAGLEKDRNQQFAVMVNFGEFESGMLGNAKENSPILRVAFHREELEAAFAYLQELKAGGFRIFLQPMEAMSYTEEEYLRLIRKTNGLFPEAFYIVDSFGAMERDDFRRLLSQADHNLRQGVALGYHAHNNLQQAYGNARYMAERRPDRDIIIDASICGMGRGAGNLNLELFSGYLNRNFQKNYKLEPILEAFDEVVGPLSADGRWGYSLPYYLSAIHNCHPYYVKFFLERKIGSMKELHALLATLSREDKAAFREDTADRYYRKYRENMPGERGISYDKNISHYTRV